MYCSNKGDCNLECARDLDRAIRFEGPETVAAFIGGPISVHHGIHVPIRNTGRRPKRDATGTA